MNIITPIKLRYKDYEGIPNCEYIEFIDIHRKQYNPAITWYSWQSVRNGRNKLHKQNDIAYCIHTKRTPGLHEQHLAEELHRHSIFPTKYTDHKGNVFNINPSVPPMALPILKDWTSEKFDALWLYWTECFPAHAWDIGRELHISNKESRDPWWTFKSKFQQKKLKQPNRQSSTPSSTAKPDKGFEYTFLSIPCRICGSMDHPALQGREDEYDDVHYVYVCPIAANTNWELESMRPCPEKLAHWCQLSSEQIDRAIERMIDNGWGQHVTRRTMQVFRACAIQYCETDSEGSDTDLFDTSILYSSK